MTIAVYKREELWIARYLHEGTIGDVVLVGRGETKEKALTALDEELKQLTTCWEKHVESIQTRYKEECSRLKESVKEGTKAKLELQKKNK